MPKVRLTETRRHRSALRVGCATGLPVHHARILLSDASCLPTIIDAWMRPSVSLTIDQVDLHPVIRPGGFRMNVGKGTSSPAIPGQDWNHMITRRASLKELLRRVGTWEVHAPQASGRSRRRLSWNHRLGKRGEHLDLAFRRSRDVIGRAVICNSLAWPITPRPILARSQEGWLSVPR